MKTHTFSATPTPAEAATPKELTMAWMSRKEVPTSSSWRATGVPQPQLSADNVPVEAQVSPGESEGQRPAAQADQEQGDKHADGLGGHGGQSGPGGHMWNPATRSRSPKILMTQAMATVSRGVLESPIPRKMEPRTL